MTAPFTSSSQHGSQMLSEVVEPGRYVVQEIRGEDKQRRRLDDLGFAVGMTVTVVACPAEGMVVVKVAGGRMALSQGTTQYVSVRRRA